MNSTRQDERSSLGSAFLGGRVVPRRMWWREALVLLVLYFVYTGIRSTFGDDVEAAFRHGRDLMKIETWLHIDIEHALNSWVSGLPVLAVVCCYAYATLHYVVTAGTLGWLFWKRPASYPQARTTIVLTTALGLVGFALMPTAPPRMLGGHWVDTMQKYAGWGWWGTADGAPKGLGGVTDQFAAMPSLHFGWALWAGWMIYRCAERRWVRALGVAYPIFIGLVVISTANHYLLDVLAGGALLLVSAVVAHIFGYAGSAMPLDEQALGSRSAAERQA